MADGVSQSMAAFKPRVSLSSGSNPNGSHASSPVNSQGPITKVILCFNGFCFHSFPKMVQLVKQILKRIHFWVILYVHICLINIFGNPVVGKILFGFSQLVVLWYYGIQHLILKVRLSKNTSSVEFLIT